jgi:hypothetical protein
MTDAGISIQEFKTLGYTATQLRLGGFPALNMRHGYTAQEFIEAGYSLQDGGVCQFLIGSR